MSSRKNAQVAFASAIAVLLFSAFAADLTITHLETSQRWVVHTYQVQNTLGEIDAAVSKAARARNSYVTTGDEQALPAFEPAIPETEAKLDELKKLTADNPKQRQSYAALEDLTHRRIALFRQAIALRKTSPENKQGQAEIASKDLSFAFERASVMQEMRDEEQRLLKGRNEASSRFFTWTVITLAVSFALALFLFSIHYWLLTTELEARALAEHSARESEESLRHLTSRLLHVQDEERRRISRELHDSLGQYLAGVKMNLEMFARSHSGDPLLTKSIQLLDDSIAETRTISHLLHPPLLEEVGFASAANWYVQGFSERSGVAVSIDVPEDLGRLPREVELVLFRVLQETLTNIHRHSKSPKAEVSLRSQPGKVILRVEDHGYGIPDQRLKTFQAKGTGFGIGLSGMRERVRELNGHLDIQSNSSGTTVAVSLPLTAQTELASTGDASEVAY
jgi:signal transduction histidine kinase